MGIIEKMKKPIDKIREGFFKLNKQQREQVSKIFDKLALGALLPVALRLMSDDKSGDGLAIAIWIVCAIIFGVISVAALAAKEGEDEHS